MDIWKLVFFRRRPSGETTISLLSNARTSFSNVRSSSSNPRISTTSSRSQSSQPDFNGKPLFNPLIRRLSQNSIIYEPSLEGCSSFFRVIWFVNLFILVAFVTRLLRYRTQTRTNFLLLYYCKIQRDCCWLVWLCIGWTEVKERGSVFVEKAFL